MWSTFCRNPNFKVPEANNIQNRRHFTQWQNIETAQRRLLLSVAIFELIEHGPGKSIYLLVKGEDFKHHRMSRISISTTLIPAARRRGTT
jgi:hypothetical protein